MTLQSEADTHPPLHLPVAIWKPLAIVWEKIGAAERYLYARTKPRAALGSGSVLVLATLFLPLVYNSCKGNKTGQTFLRAADQGSDWLGLMNFISPWIERCFYALALGLAVFALASAIASLARPAVLKNRGLTLWLHAISGILLLYMLTDFFWVFTVLWVDKLPGELEPVLGPVSLIAGMAAVAGCLRSQFIARQRVMVAIFSIAAGALFLVATNMFFEGVLDSPLFSSYTWMIALVAIPTMLLWLVPVLLWLRFGFSLREEKRAQWPGVRTRIVQIYVPVVLFDCLFMYSVVDLKVYGFIPFFIGLHLIALGYMKLAREVRSVASAT